MLTENLSHLNPYSITHGDHVEFVYGDCDRKGIVRINYAGEVFIDSKTDTYSIGYIDDITAYDNNVKNLRIIKRDDGTPIFNVGDVIDDTYNDIKAKVLMIKGDVVLLSRASDFNEAGILYTFKELQKAGWKSKKSIDEDDKKKKIKDAIKLLEDEGTLVDGKVIKNV